MAHPAGELDLSARDLRHLEGDVAVVADDLPAADRGAAPAADHVDRMRCSSVMRSSQFTRGAPR